MSKDVIIKFTKVDPDVLAPRAANEGDAGFDICANEVVTIVPLGIAKVNTGISVAIPDGYEIQVRGKSGLALHDGFSIAQGVGTIDSGYRGEIGILVKNMKPYSKTIRKGEMIGQLVLNELPKAVYELVTDLDETQRGAKGFGSTKAAQAEAKDAEVKTE